MQIVAIRRFRFQKHGLPLRGSKEGSLSYLVSICSHAALQWHFERTAFSLEISPELKNLRATLECEEFSPEYSQCRKELRAVLAPMYHMRNLIASQLHHPSERRPA